MDCHASDRSFGVVSRLDPPRPPSRCQCAEQSSPHLMAETYLLVINLLRFAGIKTHSEAQLRGRDVLAGEIMDSCGYNTFIEHAFDVPTPTCIVWSFGSKMSGIICNKGRIAGTFMHAYRAETAASGKTCTFHRYLHFRYFGDDLDGLAIQGIARPKCAHFWLVFPWLGIDIRTCR